TVAAVAFAAACRIALLVAEMVGQLRPERALDQRLLQLFEKTAISGQVFRLLIVSKQLIQQLRCNRRIGRHVSLLDKVNSQKPAYTFFRTPSSHEDPRRAEVRVVTKPAQNGSAPVA